MDKKIEILIIKNVLDMYDGKVCLYDLCKIYKLVHIKLLSDGFKIDDIQAYIMGNIYDFYQVLPTIDKNISCLSLADDRVSLNDSGYGIIDWNEYQVTFDLIKDDLLSLSVDPESAELIRRAVVVVVDLYNLNQNNDQFDEIIYNKVVEKEKICSEVGRAVLTAADCIDIWPKLSACKEPRSQEPDNFDSRCRNNA